MKRKQIILSCAGLILLFLLACGFKNEAFSEEKSEKRNLSEEFKKYWFQDGAEINVYEIEQARYGEIRKGKAVLIFVTEPFNTKKLVKADHNDKSNQEVLKLNYLKKFETGVYDYSMMTSVFFPLTSGANALKISSSSQEWCGHTFMQLENKSKFEVQLHSYFESEGEQKFSLEKGFLEDDLMNQVRVDPKLLPLGDIKILPSFFYLRLKHKEMNYLKANAELFHQKDKTSLYVLSYPDQKRKVEILFTSDFPHKILSWSESYPESWTDDTHILRSTTKLIRTKRLKYWEHNFNQDSVLRNELGL